MAERKPHCLRCQHFYITWEQPFARGCKAYGFKAKEYPCQVVHQTSNTHCQLFQKKPPTSENQENSDQEAFEIVGRD